MDDVMFAGNRPGKRDTSGRLVIDPVIHQGTEPDRLTLTMPI